MSDDQRSDCDRWVQTALGVTFSECDEAASAESAKDEGAEQENAANAPALGPQEPRALQTIVIEPDNPSIPAGQKQQFEAKGLYADGHKQPETEALAWKSSDESIAWFDDRKKGLAITGSKAGRATITARDSNTGRIGGTSLTVAPTTSEISEEDFEKGDAYRRGKIDGHYDDKDRAFADKHPELASEYEEGFRTARDEADKKWDGLGADVDKIEMSKRPDEPGGLGSQLVDMGGIGISIISILEAQGAKMFAKGVVGTTLGAILLPYSAFRLGADIAQTREDFKQAVNDLVTKFVSITALAAFERSRTLVKAVGPSAAPFNDSGKTITAETYRRDYDELDGVLRGYIKYKHPEDDFLELHKGWVLKMSKQWANFMTNPRFHE